ncbi:hypothetical protein DKM19_45110 [Streptosporangium sp. 'caverna']|nr:hypothetical protein DKM19_45110 [Streptosporangium sp. 'caverna']
MGRRQLWRSPECTLFIMTEQPIDLPHQDGKDPLYGAPMPAVFAFRAAEAADEGFAAVRRFEGADTMLFEARQRVRYAEPAPK